MVPCIKFTTACLCVFSILIRMSTLAYYFSHLNLELDEDLNDAPLIRMRSSGQGSHQINLF